MRFIDRAQAGQMLAEELRGRVDEHAIVLALPRGGVPVAVEVSRALGLPLEVFVARKLGAPAQPELGIGAVAEGGAVWIDRALARLVGADEDAIAEIASREEQELRRRVEAYRGGRPLPDLRGRTVVLVDDGIATGGTVRASVRALQRLDPDRIIVAAPVVAQETAEALRGEADELVAILTPMNLDGIGLWYEDFRQVTDQQVVDALARATVARAEYLEASAAENEAIVSVLSDGERLAGDLTVPRGARGLVLFAHGSGSARKSVRNRAVARRLNDAGCATLLFDLLTPAEEEIDRESSALRCDIALLARRLVGAIDWVQSKRTLREMPIGLFGASTGAAAALVAAAERPEAVKAVVSRGGRVDLAENALENVRAPTLFIVGEADEIVLELNSAAFDTLRCEKRLVLVQHATHLFEEPGALEHVAKLAAQWFSTHLQGQLREDEVVPLPHA